jgi:hypothetical protein
MKDKNKRNQWAFYLGLNIFLVIFPWLAQGSSLSGWYIPKWNIILSLIDFGWS